MDPRRQERIRECPDNPSDGLPTGEQFNALGMVLSLLALLMKVCLRLCVRQQRGSYTSYKEKNDLVFSMFSCRIIFIIAW